MAMAAFGVDEKLHCIVDVGLKGPEGEELCLGYKTSVRLVGGPVWITDDGYVLVLKSTKKSYFPMPEGAELSELQGAELLPETLPPYSLSAGQLFFGTITWWVLIGAVAIALISHWRGRHRRAFLASDEPPSTDPPALKTDGDRWLRDQVMANVPQGDVVIHQAYGFTSDPANGGVAAAAKRKVRFAGLTRDHLVLIEGRVGALGPLLEAQGIDCIPRGDIVDVGADEEVVVFHLADGRAIELWHQKKQKHFSNQWRFARDVPRLLGEQLAATARGEDTA